MFARLVTTLSENYCAVQALTQHQLQESKYGTMNITLCATTSSCLRIETEQPESRLSTSSIEYNPEACHRLPTSSSWSHLSPGRSLHKIHPQISETRSWCKGRHEFVSSSGSNFEASALANFSQPEPRGHLASAAAHARTHQILRKFVTLTLQKCSRK